MNLTNLIPTIIFVNLFSLSIIGQSSINPPEGIKQNLSLSQGQSPTIIQINDAYSSIPDSIDGDLNKEYIKSQRWMRYVFGKYNVEDSVTFNLTPYSNAVKAIYDSPLNCRGSDPANWTSEGPRYIPPTSSHGQNGGWTNSVYGDPDDTTRMLIGTNTSGIFKTEDEGNSWVNVTDTMEYPVLGVNQIIPAPDDEDYLLATTGTLFIDGGLIYSDDRGDTWNAFTNETPFFNWISYHPTKDGCLFGVSDEEVYFSNDYGASWQDVGLPDSLDPTHMMNYRILTLDTNLFFATIYKYGIKTELYSANFSIDVSNNLSLTWNHERRNDDFKTNDDVILFYDFSNKLPTKFYLQVTLVDTTANYTARDNLHQSFDNGESFHYLSDASISVNSQAGGTPYKNVLIASLNDTAVVYWGSVKEIQRTHIYDQEFDDILSEASSPGHHDDYRSFYILNNNGKDRMMFGNDGGPALVRDGLSANPTISSLNGDLSINLIHAFHLHEPTKRIAYGFQDHAMRYKDGDTSYSEPFIWEGSAAMIQDRYPLGIVGENAYNSIYDVGEHSFDNFNSTNPIVEEDFADERLALGAYFVNYRHYPERFSRGVRKYENYGIYNGGVALNRAKNVSEVSEIDSSLSIGAVAICQRNPNYIYAAEFNIREGQGNSLHKLYRSEDDGQTWNNLVLSTVTLSNGTFNLSQLLPYKGIRAIAVDHLDSSVVYCGISSTMTDEYFRVIKSTDYGDSFIDYSEGLPALPVERLLTVESDENLIFCATSVGVYYRMDGMSQWECFSENLPKVEVTGMQYDYCANELYVSTYGRGMWKTPVPFDISSSYQTEISGTETWSDFKILKEDLVIKDGGVLTITDTVKIAYDKKIIVEPGGRLNVDGGVLTNYCSDFWHGIEVWGNHDQNQTLAKQGYLQIKNGAVIENAKTAVHLWKPNDWSSTGGIVEAFGSTFRNNWRSVEFMPYHDFNTNFIEVNNRGLFSNCDFVWDDDYENLGGTSLIPAITLYDVFGVRIKGCDFIDDRTYITSYEDRAIGIKSIDASYKVTGRRLDIANIGNPSYTHDDYDSTDFDISNFVNLRKGVFAMNANSQSVVTVDHCKFYNDRVGIWMIGVENPLITRNYFLYDNNHPSDIFKMNHVILDASSGFQIEGNKFESALSSETIDGLIVSNSGLENNEVYRNEYDGVYAANLAFGVNTNDLQADDEEAGLQWLCNDYGDYKYDQLYVTPTNITFSDNNGVRLKQGIPGKPAGNTFSSGFDSGQDEFHFGNNDLDETLYYAYSNSNPEIPTEVNGNIIVETDEDPNQCLSNFGSPIIGVTINRLLQSTIKLDLEDDLDDAIVKLNNKRADLQYILDSVNTSQLYYKVENLDSTTWNDLHDDLIDASPYLNRDLMITLGSQTNPHYPHKLYKELALENPEIAQSASFMDFLLTKPDPLPRRDYDEVNGKRYDTISERGVRINKIIETTEEVSRLSNLLMKDELSDTTQVKWMNYRDFLMDREDFMLFQQLSDFYYGIKKMGTGSYYLDSLDALQHNLDSSYVKNNINSYIKVKEYVKDSLLNNDGIIEGLDSTQIVELIQLRDLYEGYLGGEHASNLLCFHADSCKKLSAYPTYPSWKMANSTITDNETITGRKESHNFIIVPNPNEGVFVLRNLSSEKVKDLKVFSLDGKNIQFEKWNEENKTHLSLKTVEKGVYYIHITTKNNKQYVEKFVMH